MNNMAPFKTQDIPVKDLQALGLHDGKKSLLDESTRSALLRGNLTDFVRIKELDFGGTGKVSVDAKLSLRRKSTGETALLIHPIYRERPEHPDLTTGESAEYAKGGTLAKVRAAHGTIKAFGPAPYKFDEKNKKSFFVELEKEGGKSVHIWGAGLESALEKSGHRIGDRVQLASTGKERTGVETPIYSKDGEKVGSRTETSERNKWEVADFQEARKQERTTVYEFDPETNSFVSADSNEILAPDEINGMRLTPEQKRELREGKKVSLPDGTEMQAAPAAKNGIRANKRLLIASLFIDGGMTFVLYKTVMAIVKMGEKQKQMDSIYSKGYADAVKKIRIDLERKHAMHPNDRSIAEDLNVVQKEAARFAPAMSESMGEGPSINETMARANDPDTLRNAEERSAEQERGQGRKR